MESARVDVLRPEHRKINRVDGLHCPLAEPQTSSRDE
jgi:hypothetical protein